MKRFLTVFSAVFVGLAATLVWAQPAIMLVDGDHGAFTCTDGTCTLDAATTAVTGTTAGTFTIDSDGSPGTAILDTAGAGTIALGSADVTNITLDSDVGLTFAENSDSINNLTDGAFDFTRDDAGAVSLLCSDDDATCAMIYDAGGAAAITIGSADVTNVTVNSDVGLTFANNSDSVNNLADATFDFTRDDTGIVTITCSDDDATAGCTYDAGGASPIVIGSADVTTVTITTDDTGDGTDLVLPADAINKAEIEGAEVCGAILHAKIDPTEAGATDDYMSMNDHAGSTTEANEDDFYMPTGMTLIHSLRCDIDVAPGAGNDDWRIVIRDDGGDTAVTCDISETATNCTDTSNSVAPAAGSKLNFDVHSDIGAGTDPDAAAELFCSVCLGH